MSPDDLKALIEMARLCTDFMRQGMTMGGGMMGRACRGGRRDRPAGPARGWGGGGPQSAAITPGQGRNFRTGVRAGTPPAANLAPTTTRDLLAGRLPSPQAV